MKKRFAALLLAIAMLTLTACGGNQTQTPNTPGDKENSLEVQTPETQDVSKDPVVKLTFGGTAAAEDLITRGMERIAETCKERSGGSIQISVFPASQLGDAVAQLESMVGGGQDMMIEAQGSYMQQYGVKDAAINSFGLVGTQELLAKELKSDMWKELEQQFKAETGIETLANNWVRQPTVIASKVPLRTIDDFSGVKLRVVPSKTTTAVYEALGFAPTPVAYSEVYLSLSQNVIDATIASFDAMYTMAFYEVAPYITKYGNSCTNVAVWINGSKFDSMTPAQQEILREACVEAGDWYVQESNAVMDDYIAKMEANGATIIDVDDAFRNTCNEKLRDTALQFESEGTWSEGLYEKLSNLLAE